MPPVIAYFAPDPLGLPVILSMAAFVVVWSALAMLAVASMLKGDRSAEDQLVDRKLEALSSQTSRLSEEHQDLGADLRQQVSDLEETVRATLKEELEIALPPRPTRLRATMRAGGPRMSATLTVVGGSKLVRTRQWFRHAMRRLWAVVYGKPDDN